MQNLDPGGTDIQNRPELGSGPWPGRHSSGCISMRPTGRWKSSFPLLIRWSPITATVTSPTRAPVRRKTTMAGVSMARFTYQFAADTEVTGYIHLHAWVEVKNHDDMDLFCRVLNLDAQDNILFHYCYGLSIPARTTVCGSPFAPWIRINPLSTSRYRALQNPKKLSPGEIVPIDLKFWPTSQIFHKGEKLQLIIAGWDSSWLASHEPPG